MFRLPNENFGMLDGGFSNYEGTINLPRHRWYYYKEGFSPELVEKAIETSGILKGDVILDPFNGSGTTTLTAALLGYGSLGIEVNPFTSFLSSVKLQNANSYKLVEFIPKIAKKCLGRTKSDLLGFSTFTYSRGLKKWLFNKGVLNAFENGWRFTSIIKDRRISDALKFALITSAMENCNAVKDGKCMRYRETWRDYGYNASTFIETLTAKVELIGADILSSPISAPSKIINGDVRKILSDSKNFPKFKLCVTSPPYLNTFDYTDIYRPELFLGKFVNDNDELYKLRLETVRSHIQAKWKLPDNSDFGPLYDEAIKHLNSNIDLLMHKDIPIMAQAYFEDMKDILTLMKLHAEKRAQIWLVVSNSAYADYEIPVDLIIADIGSRVGWELKEIGVLRKVQKRKTKYSPNITELRESVIIFENRTK